jgi:protein required for attachment to host cells
MTHPMHPILQHGTWLAVCDGQKALLLENYGTHEFPKLEMREVFTQDDPPAHLQGSDGPGRGFSGKDGRRAAFEEKDFHAQAAQSFIERFGDHLNQCITDKGIRSLVLIAPAKALGILRGRLSGATRHAVTGELDRDYVKLPLYEIERHLQAIAL